MIVTTRRSESSIGVGILDCDHREMGEALRELDAEVATGWNHSRVGYQLHDLARFTLIHFALEEGMMEAMRYPMVTRHRTNHRHLMQQMNGFVSRYDREDLIPDREWLSSLTTSHHAHVHADDMYYGDWLNSMEISKEN